MFFSWFSFHLHYPTLSSLAFYTFLLCIHEQQIASNGSPTYAYEFLKKYFSKILKFTAFHSGLMFIYNFHSLCFHLWFNVFSQILQLLFIMFIHGLVYIYKFYLSFFHLCFMFILNVVCISFQQFAAYSHCCPPTHRDLALVQSAIAKNK